MKIYVYVVFVLRETLPTEKKSCIMKADPGCAQICFIKKQSQDEVVCEKYKTGDRI